MKIPEVLHRHLAYMCSDTYELMNGYTEQEIANARERASEALKEYRHKIKRKAEIDQERADALSFMEHLKSL